MLRLNHDITIKPSTRNQAILTANVGQDVRSDPRVFQVELDIFRRDLARSESAVGPHRSEAKPGRVYGGHPGIGIICTWSGTVHQGTVSSYCCHGSSQGKSSPTRGGQAIGFWRPVGRVRKTVKAQFKLTSRKAGRHRGLA